ncbi:MAG: class I SAM-dependent methyltransferase [Candidatus Bathyarchaeota archaeon]|nr:MAG: class I SAM-dependent methyltransferase [Candidatus Bathyarchaeota archaeon]
MVPSRADQVLNIIEKTVNAWYPIIGPWRGRILADTVRRLRPRRVLEVGTLVGYSAILMAKELDSDAEIITLEIDRDEAELAEENIRRARVKPTVRVLVGDALEIIPILEGYFDLVFLDAVKNEYYDYLRLVEAKLYKGSVVVADNAEAYAYSMKRYLDYVRYSGRYESRLVSADGDGMEISTKL